jgi:hypothetical protein
VDPGEHRLGVVAFGAQVAEADAAVLVEHLEQRHLLALVASFEVLAEAAHLLLLGLGAALQQQLRGVDQIVHPAVTCPLGDLQINVKKQNRSS